MKSNMVVSFSPCLSRFGSVWLAFTAMLALIPQLKATESGPATNLSVIALQGGQVGQQTSN